MELLNKNNIINDNKIDLVIGDTHGDFTAILNVLNSYLNTNIKFQYYEDLTLQTINNHITLNTSLMKHKDFINSDEKFIFEGLEKGNEKENNQELNQVSNSENNKVSNPENNQELNQSFNRSLNNIRLIILGDIFDTNNYLTLRL